MLNYLWRVFNFTSWKVCLWLDRYYCTFRILRSNIIQNHFFICYSQLFHHFSSFLIYLWTLTYPATIIRPIMIVYPFELSISYIPSHLSRSRPWPSTGSLSAGTGMDVPAGSRPSPSARWSPASLTPFAHSVSLSSLRSVPLNSICSLRRQAPRWYFTNISCK